YPAASSLVGCRWGGKLDGTGDLMSAPLHEPYGHVPALVSRDRSSTPEAFLYAVPEADLKQARNQWTQPRDICVIGGGIAGLCAAYELSRIRDNDGDRVTVLERSNRWGGRLQTAEFGAVHAELGAMRIPRRHECTLHYLKEFHLKTRPF